jgi:hypothetical protein
MDNLKTTVSAMIANWTGDAETHSIAYYLMIFTPVIIFIGVFAATGYAIYYVACLAYSKWVAKFYSSVTIRNKDEMYEWVAKWIMDKNIIKDDNSALNANVKHRDMDWLGGGDEREKPEMQFWGSPGRDHMFYHDG